MGNFSLDLTKDKKFLIFPYTMAAAGAIAGVGTAIAAALPVLPVVALLNTITALAGGTAAPVTLASVMPTLPVLAAAGAAGAVIGGVVVPVALAALVGGIGFLATRKKAELEVIPLGMAVVGAGCAKALFVTPFQAAYKGLRSVFNTKAKKTSKTKPANAPKPPQGPRASFK